MHKDRYLPYMAGALTAVIFGFSFMFTKITLPAFGGDVFHLLSYRFLLAAGVMGVLRVLGVIRPRYRGKPVGQLFLIGLIQPVLYFTCETLGLRLVPSSQAGLMIALIPVVVTILGAVFLRERPTWLQVLFVLISVGGVAAIHLSGGLTGGADFWGTVLLGGAILSAAVYNILSRRASLAFQPVAVTWLMLNTGAVAFTLITWIRIAVAGGHWQAYFSPLGDLTGMLALCYLSVLSTVAAFFLLNYTLSKLEAARSAVMANITTLVSVAAGVLILSEPFGWFHAVGSVMIIAGVWGVNRFHRRPLSPEEAVPQPEAPLS